MKAEVKEAKAALDTIIKKSRVHLYKPIQIGEILCHYRISIDELPEIIRSRHYELIHNNDWVAE